MSAAEVQRIVQTLLTPNAQNFENFIAELMNPDNQRRKFAEEVLMEMKKHADLFVRYLTSTLRHSNVVAYRTFSAVLLRKCLTIESPMLWPSLAEPVKHEVKNDLLLVLSNEKEGDVLLKTADAIAELGRYLLMSTGWPELPPTLFQLLESQSPDVVVAAFRMIGALVENADVGIFAESAQQLMAAMNRGLNQGPPAVKVEAISALCTIAVEPSKLSDALKPMIPKVIEVLMERLNAKDIDSCETILESLIDVAEDEPRFLKKSLREVLDPMMKIALSESVDNSIRMLAAELLLSIAEQKDHGLRNIFKAMSNFTECLFEVFMVFLLDIEDVPEWHSAEEEDEEVGNGDLFEVGMESLDRLALAFGGKTLVPIAGATLNGCVSDASWKKRHAAFICLSQIAEGCDKIMLQEVDALTNMCINGLNDTSPKVRWSACQAIGQMCTDLAPDIQGSQHQKIIPTLIAKMEDSNHPRVQAHAAAAIVNFCEECEEDDILPYLDPLIKTLISLLHSVSQLVSESALTALATVADRANQHFISYYDATMPLLRTMFAQAVDPKMHRLRAKALECISLIGAAVGKDRFRQDASEVMQLIHQLHQSQLSPSDPLPSYTIQAGARMCRSLGRDFLPYLEIVMPHLLRHLMNDPEITVADPLSIDPEDEDTEIFHVGGKIVRLRSSAMEEKANACQMLACYVDALKDAFLPYVWQVTGIVVPLLKFIFNEEVRSAAFACLPELLDAALAGLNKEAGVTVEFVQQMVEAIWPAALDALTNEDELEVQEAALHSIAGMVDVLTPQFLSVQMVESCFETLQSIFDESEIRRKERINDLAQAEDEDLDEAENIALEDHDDLEEMEADVLDELATVLSSFMKKYGDAVMNYVTHTLPIVHKLLEKGRSPTEHRIAICIIDDILEYCPQAGGNYAKDFLPFLVTGSTEQDATLRQCSIYGMGVVASKHPEVFQHWIPEVLPKLVRTIQHPASKSRENQLATDNAISAIGKIIYQFPGKADQKIVELWLKNLPLLHDDLEARIMHDLFVTLVENQDVRILGDKSQNLMHVLELLVQMLAVGEMLTTSNTGKRICTLLQSFSRSMGHEAVSAAVTKLTPKQQKVFHEFSSNLESQIQNG